jgi:predicted methyltransferase MtxX (methanogen marker protein 4)
MATMKNFRVQIRAYGYYADFEVESEDNSKDLEKALVDKLGKNDIKWEKDGFISKSKIWVTYEEVIDANAHQRSIQSEEGSRNRVGGGATG